MASEVKTWWVVFVVLSVMDLCPWALGAPQVPCYFIFGDSLADSGNNNLLPTIAKANYQPYGIDFLTGPTGRFCNGRTTVDVLGITLNTYNPFSAQLLGFDNFIPPFATATGPDILQGVNYASGAAGIRQESGQQQGARISMDEQKQNHQITVLRIAQMLGSKDAALNYLSKCIYTVGIGSNDYINNYFMPKLYPTSRLYTPDQFAEVLINQYSRQLRTLYNDYKLRKAALIGLGQIGCAPFEVAMYGATNGSACVETINSAVQLFNVRLKSLVDDLNNNLTDAKFTYIDSFGGASASVLAALGFTVANAPCCEVGVTNFTCRPFSNLCPNRNEYVFWDNVHPTEAINVIVAQKYYFSQLPSDAHPYSIGQLAQL